LFEKVVNFGVPGININNTINQTSKKVILEEKAHKRCMAQENVQLVPGEGKHVTDAKW